jgi:integrase
MPKKLPPYVSRERSRHGRVNFYFRRAHGKRVRLPDLYDPAFDEAYMTALHGSEVTTSKGKVSTSSLEWLIDRYRQSSAYSGLAPATRRQRDNIFSHVIEGAGHAPYKAVTRKTIVDGRERRKDTPAQARNFLDAMRGLFRWAVDVQLIEHDPTAGVKNPKRPKTAGFPAWTEDDLQLFEKHWPIGTKERVWLDVLLYTGLRRGDAVLLGRQHVRDGIATLRTGKTGTEVTIPILQVLQRTLEAGPTGDLTFIVGESGRSLTKESFGNMFRAACREAGVDKSAHGLRKIAATRAAEAGATVAELEAMFGWNGGTMASLYTKTANRRRLALRGWERN